jgi:hypothetical protein
MTMDTSSTLSPLEFVYATAAAILIALPSMRVCLFTRAHCITGFHCSGGASCLACGSCANGDAKTVFLGIEL